MQDGTFMQEKVVPKSSSKKYEVMKNSKKNVNELQKGLHEVIDSKKDKPF